MYAILCDGATLYDPRVDSLKLSTAKLKLEAGKAGGLDLVVYPSHPLYAQIHRFKSAIEVYHDATLIFRGRVLNDDVGLNKEKRITCEGDLAFLNDSVIRPYNFTGTITAFLQSAISSHNAQVELEKEFVLGTVTVTDPNDYIVRSSIASDVTWNVLKTKLVDVLGGYLIVRRSGGVNYLDYLADSEYRSDQEIKLGKNILDLSKGSKGEDIITALIPYGAKLKDETGKDTDERLTISSVNGGVDYVFDQEAVDQYGWIFGTETWNDVTVAENLMTKASAELTARRNLDISLTLSAIDLSMVDPSIDKIRVFEYVKVISPAHDLWEFMLVTKLDLDLLHPRNNKFTVGSAYSTFTDKQLGTDSAIKDLVTIVEQNQTTTGNYVDSRITTLSSSIVQTEASIRTDVAASYTSKTELEEYKASVSTQFTQTSDSFNFTFQELVQSITELDGDTKTRFEEIVKYIRFIDGNIVLGEVGNELTLRISNDRISFLQSSVEVAYLSNNKLYITDAHVLNSIRIGNFAFIPRANGSLDFKKVVS